MSHPKSSFYIDKSGSLQVRVRSDGRVWVLDRWSGNEWFELMPMDGESPTRRDNADTYTAEDIPRGTYPEWPLY